MKRIIWKIYLAIPFKKQVYLILRRIYIPQKNISQYLQFVDNMNIQVDSQRQFRMRNYGYQLETEIFWYGIFGGWEKVSMQLWYDLCQESYRNMLLRVLTGRTYFSTKQMTIITSRGQFSLTWSPELSTPS